jgi:hypothetical protein
MMEWSPELTVIFRMAALEFSMPAMTGQGLQYAPGPDCENRSRPFDCRMTLFIGVDQETGWRMEN